MVQEPTITCPSCRIEIKLTESLAAPLIESTRMQFEKRLAQQNMDVAKREQAINDRAEALAKEKQAVDMTIAEKLKHERAHIAAEESRKARLALGTDIEEKAKEVHDLQELLKARDEKLATAQKAQADLLVKQRELDDQKRELELTVEKRIAESLATERDQAKKETEERVAQTVNEKDLAIADMRKQIGDVVKREQTIKDQEAGLKKERGDLEQQIAETLLRERTQIAADEAKKARLAWTTDLEQKGREIADLNIVLKQRDEKLAAAQKAQAELIRKQRELDDAKREMDLTIETRVQESLTKVRETAKKDAEQELSLKVIEKDQTIDSMKKQIDELKRKAEQGSQQLQGEALELQLESILSHRFPHDQIEPVAKGERGADILQRVISPTGSSCGLILWESKRTRNWSDGWLAKVRENQRQAKAEIAIIASAALPKDVESFDQIEGVWIVHPKCVVPVAMSLRHMLMEVNAARAATDGQQTKMEMMYGYLTGPKFRLRVQAIVEAFSTMGEDLIKEKKATMKQWAKREEQIHRVMEATVGMYGEMQGIAGKSLQEIEGLTIEGDDSLPLLNV